MNTNTPTPQQPEELDAELQNETPVEQTALPEWHTPVITRIDVKRTLNSPGSQQDGVTLPTI